TTLTKEFELYNMCAAEGKYIALDSLFAKIVTSELRPNITLTIISGGQSSTAALMPNSWTTVFGNIPKQGSARVRISINVPSTVEKSFSFGLSFKATIANNEFFSSPTTLNFTITPLNLKTCLSFPEKLSIAKENNSTTMEFENNCGIPVEVFLCKGDPGCSGGTDIGNIVLSQQKFTINANDSKSVEILRGVIPGAYDITVHVRKLNGTWQKTRSSTVIVHSKKYFEIEPYEISLLEKGAKTGLILKNRMLQEQVCVKADYCAWKEAFDNGRFESASTGAAIGGAVAGPIGAIIGGLIGWLFGGKSCHDYYATSNVPDYVINLSGAAPNNRQDATYTSDLLSLTLSDPRFVVRRSTENSNQIFQQTSGSEDIGITIENIGAEEKGAVFAVLEVKAREHIHGDPSHSNASCSNIGEVFCRNGNFGNYNIGANANEGNCTNSWEREHTEKFHIKIVTGEEEEEIPLPPEVKKCSGALAGTTGKEALPRIKLSWDWQDIKAEECDADNENYIYCDATQFSIALVKKLKMLDDWLAANSYSFACPRPRSNQQQFEEVNNETSQHRVADNKIGLVRLSHMVKDNELTLYATIENNSSETQNVSVQIELRKRIEEEPEICTKQLEVPANDQITAECKFSVAAYNSTSSTYIASAKINANNANALDSTVLTRAIEVMPTEEELDRECWLDRTTELLNGIPTLEYFVNPNIPNNENSVRAEVAWTPEINSFEELHKLLVFDVYLMKDSFSEDFMNDFAEYYTNASIASSTYFKEKFANYFKEGKLRIRQRFANTSEIPSAGKYRAYVKINFGNSWKLFENNEPSAEIEVLLQLIDKPERDWPFYYMPIDGKLGINTENGRQGYGINITNGSIKIKQYETEFGNISNSNALKNIDVEEDISIENLNTNLATWGEVLRVVAGNEPRIVKKFSRATPLILKVSANEKGKEAAARYELLKNQQPIADSRGIILWTGMGQCRDFSGIPAFEAFNMTPDSKDEHNPSYGISWNAESVQYTGDLYLRGVLFTPLDAEYSLSSIHNAEFITPDAKGSKIPLNGVSTMPLNNSSEAIESIEAIFDMVGDEYVCVTNNGVEARFWWNPEKLYETKGSITSIKEFESSLGEGKCIQ
ncbi:MAG: hypothetical protein J7L14_01265, partial [Candidatus Diapherotrites archaeon]|nr:hypothetical protein [Candidatus Diapherotrites archaeon]